MSKAPNNSWQSLLGPVPDNMDLAPADNQSQQSKRMAPDQTGQRNSRPPTYDKAARLLRLYLTLKSSAPRGWTTAELRTHMREKYGFHMEQRTAQRDLQELSEHFGEIRRDGDQWSHPKIQQMDGMDVYMALSLKLIKQYLRGLLPNALHKSLDGLVVQAEQILAEARHPAIRSAAGWDEKVCMLAWGPQREQPEITAAVQREVYEALGAGEKLNLAYSSRSKPPCEYDVSPLGLVLYRDMLYLVAMLDKESRPRYFSLRRIDSARRIPVSTAKAPAQWNSLQEFAQQNPPIPDDYPEKTAIRLRFNDMAIRNLQEVPLKAPHSITENPDGSFTLEAELKPNRELLTWVLYYGANVEVLAPPAFRERVRQELRAALLAYDR